MGGKRAEGQIAIGESPRRCFEAIVDYESFPEWQRAVRDCEVVSQRSSSCTRSAACTGPTSKLSSA